jgi:uncharacterized protein
MTATTLHEAATRGDALATKTLLDANPEQVNAADEHGWTPLHLAAHYGFRAVAELLLAAGADANARSVNSMANTPLHAAAAGQQADLALLLLEHGAEINATQHGGFTALHSAAQNGQLELVNLLLARGADPLATNEGGRTARDFAADGNHTAVLEVLDKASS